MIWLDGEGNFVTGTVPVVGRHAGRKGGGAVRVAHCVRESKVHDLIVAERFDAPYDRVQGRQLRKTAGKRERIRGNAKE